MLPVDLFKIPVFTLSALTAICSFATQGLAFVALPSTWNRFWVAARSKTRFLITPWPIVVALTATFGRPAVGSLSAGMLGGAGRAMLRPA